MSKEEVYVKLVSLYDKHPGTASNIIVDNHLEIAQKLGDEMHSARLHFSALAAGLTRARAPIVHPLRRRNGKPFGDRCDGKYQISGIDRPTGAGTTESSRHPSTWAATDPFHCWESRDPLRGLPFGDLGGKSEEILFSRTEPSCTLSIQPKGCEISSRNTKAHTLGGREGDPLRGRNGKDPAGGSRAGNNLPQEAYFDPERDLYPPMLWTSIDGLRHTYVRFPKRHKAHPLF